MEVLCPICGNPSSVDEETELCGTCYQRMMEREEVQHTISSSDGIDPATLTDTERRLWAAGFSREYWPAIMRVLAAGVPLITIIRAATPPIPFGRQLIIDEKTIAQNRETP